jgi:hypothetical protein
MLQSVFALAGVSPSSYEVRFEPGLERNFTFQFIFDEGISTKINLEGELSPYFRVDRNGIYGSGIVNVEMVLPDKIDVAGDQIIRIVAKPDIERGKGIGITAEAVALIKVVVPFPGEYAEVDLLMKDFNLDENVEHRIKIINRGNKPLEVDPQVQILMGENLKETVKIQKETLNPFEFKEYNFILNEYYFPGKYHAFAFVRYGDELARDEESFNIGENTIDIINHTSRIKRGTLEKYEVLVESLSVKKINDIHGEIIIGNKSFTSNSFDMLPFEKRLIQIYVDSQSLKNSEAKIIIHFRDKSVIKNIDFFVEDNEKYLLYVGIIIIFCLIFFIFKSRFSNMKNNNKR